MNEYYEMVKYMVYQRDIQDNGRISSSKMLVCILAQNMEVNFTVDNWWTPTDNKNV